MRTSVFLFALMTAVAAAQAQDAAATRDFGPLGGLVGACWRGEASDGGAIDEHCYEWMLGGDYLRDRHVLTLPEGPPVAGETVYDVSAQAGHLRFSAWSDLGGIDTNEVRIEAGAVYFPEETQQDKAGFKHVVRTVLRRVDGDSYALATEEHGGGDWVEKNSTIYRRVDGP